MADNDYSYSEDQPMTLGQRMLRARGITTVDDSDNAGGTPAASSVGTPNAGATPNTAEPHENKPTAAASGDAAAQGPSGKTSIGQRMVGSSVTSGMKAYNDDGSPAEPVVTGTDPKTGRPTIGIAPSGSTQPAAATASTPTAAPSTASAPTTIGQRLMKVGPPPAPPQLDPNYSATQEAVRKDSVVTPKIDPTTGKTLDQYKPGLGTRLLRGVSDFMTGGIPGVIQGGIDPKSPGFYGKGAVNNQYTKDEMARNARLDADNAAVKSMDDEYSQKEKGYGHQLTSYNDEARAAGKQDSDEIRNKYQTDLNTERSAHNKETENLRRDLNDLRSEPKTYEQYVGALEAETDPGKKAILQRVVDRLEKQKTAGKGPKLSAKDQLKLDSYMQDNKIDDVADMTNADIKKALAASDGPAHVKDRQTFEAHWAKQLGPGSPVEKKYDAERQAVLKSYGADKDVSVYEKNKAEIEPKLAEIEANRESAKSDLQTEKDKEAEQYQIYGKPAKQQTPAPAVSSPGGDQETMAVPATTDSKGQPLAAIPAPIASVRTGGPKPSPATSADTVRVQKPDGTVGTIPKANAQRAQARGWKVLQ